MTQISFAVNDDNDLYLDQYGNMVLAYDIDSTLQQCAQRLQVMQGECVLDQQLGMPNFETIWRSSSKLPQYIAAAYTQLLGISSVKAVTSFDAAIIGDSVSYQAKILTIYGEAILDGSN